MYYISVSRREDFELHSNFSDRIEEISGKEHWDSPKRPGTEENMADINRIFLGVTLTATHEMTNGVEKWAWNSA